MSKELQRLNMEQFIDYLQAGNSIEAYFDPAATSLRCVFSMHNNLLIAFNPQGEPQLNARVHETMINLCRVVPKPKPDDPTEVKLWDLRRDDEGDYYIITGILSGRYGLWWYPCEGSYDFGIGCSFDNVMVKNSTLIKRNTVLSEAVKHREDLINE